MKRCVVALLALALSGCAASNNEFAKGSGKTLAIDKKIWASYQSYVALLANTHPGAFVVSVDGYGASWSWCEEMRCRTTTGYANDALRDCKQYYAMDCVIFARNADIAVNYEVIE